MMSLLYPATEDGDAYGSRVGTRGSQDAQRNGSAVRTPVGAPRGVRNEPIRLMPTVKPPGHDPSWLSGPRTPSDPCLHVRPVATGRTVTRPSGRPRNRRAGGAGAP